MRCKTATDRVKTELHRALDQMRSDFERIELLAAALDVFSEPIPEYEPKFQHLRSANRQAKELQQASARSS